jgi:fatty-acyl-CoA synthase
VEDLAQVLELNAKRVLEKEAITFKGQCLSYRQLDQMAEAVASGLGQLGVEAGSKVAYVQPNWPEFAYLIFALAKLGAIGVPLSTYLRTSELSHLVLHSEAQVLIMPAEFMGFDYISFFGSVRRSLPRLKHILVVGQRCGQGMLPFQEVMRSGKPLAQPRMIVPNQPAAILYTSGTTGRPKGAITSHGALVGSAKTMANILHIGSDDVVLTLLPMSHAAGYLNFLWSMVSGARTVLMDVFKPRGVLDIIASEGVTITSHVPSGWIRIIEEAKVSNRDLSSLQRVIMTGAPCPPSLVEELASVMGCEVDITYGQTEGLMLTMTTSEDNREERTRTVGRPIPGVEMRIVDKNSRELGPNQIGEIVCRAYNITLGYYKAPEQTKATVDEGGWHHTGDLGSWDEKGYLRIVGRQDDVIINRGFNVYPREVEDFLVGHPKIAKAAVIGVPDDFSGEVVWAYVVAKGETIPTEEEIIQFCSGRIAYYKVPQHVRVVAELPMTSSGKTRRFELRQEAVKEKKGNG